MKKLLIILLILLATPAWSGGVKTEDVCSGYVLTSILEKSCRDTVFRDRGDAAALSFVSIGAVNLFMQLVEFRVGESSDVKQKRLDRAAGMYLGWISCRLKFEF